MAEIFAHQVSPFIGGTKWWINYIFVAQALADNWLSESMLIIIEIKEIWNKNKKKEIECKLAYHLEILHLIWQSTF